MKRRRRVFAALAVLLIPAVIAAAVYLYLRQQFGVVHAPPSTATIVEIPPGLGARGVFGLLQEKGVIDDPNVAMAYVFLNGYRSRLRAGEYLFDKPMTVPEIVRKLVSGAIYLHRFTVPEGLTVAETAMRWQEQGFGSAEEFAAAARDAVPSIRDLDDRAESLEGYLFPETYSFPSRTSARRAVDVMLDRFRRVLQDLMRDMPSESWPLNIRDTVILASLVESEASQGDERPLVASVYLNRLRRNILLQCDPTVIYALERENKYRGRLTLNDLAFDSKYNTYRYPGLPPGAIASPGYLALQAAVQPAATEYLFFVRTEGGRHTFTESLADHNRAVAAYRSWLQRQRSSAAARPSSSR